MGTFHAGKGDLHGITVVVDTAGPRLYVGRCEEVTTEAVVLNDANCHEEVPGGVSKREYLRQAAQVGFWPRLKRVSVPRAEVVSIERLGAASATS